MNGPQDFVPEPINETAEIQTPKCYTNETALRQCISSQIILCSIPESLREQNITCQLSTCVCALSIK